MARVMQDAGKSLCLCMRMMWEPSVRSYDERLLGLGTKAKHSTVMEQACDVPEQSACKLQFREKSLKN